MNSNTCKANYRLSCLEKMYQWSNETGTKNATKLQLTLQTECIVMLKLLIPSAI